MFLNTALYTRAQNYDPMVGLGDEVSETLNYKRFVFDFSVVGGLIGTLALQDEQGATAVLPVGSLILSVILDFITPAAGATATVSFGCTGAADLLGATAVASLTGLVAGIPVMTAATAVKVATGTVTLARRNFSIAAKPVVATVATANLTAGKCYVHTTYARSLTT
jgi:hypothetical protein